jgi:hypothetical protein
LVKAVGFGMRLVFRLFGLFPILVIDGTYEYAEQEDESDPPSFEGGSAHNFERDYFPLSPTAHHEWEWEDKMKGFGFK